MKDINSFDSLPHRGFVFVRYTLRVFTGQSVKFDGKVGKKNSSIGFPWRDCFARVLGRKISIYFTYMRHIFYFYLG